MKIFKGFAVGTCILFFLSSAVLAKSDHSKHDHAKHDHGKHDGHSHAKPTSKKEVLAFDFKNHSALWSMKLPAVEGKVLTVRAYEATGQDRMKVSAKPTDLILVLEPADAAKLWRLKRLDATMPGHNHGMNTLPVLKRVKKNRYHAKNFALHMLGDWEFVLTAQTSGKKKSKYKVAYVVKP